jgi:arylsulfatase A-like enzyme
MPPDDGKIAPVPRGAVSILRLAALRGASALLIYAILECGFAVVAPWLLQPSDLYQPLHFGATVLLFAIYPVAGAIVTALLALLAWSAIGKAWDLHRAPARLCSCAATFGLTALFAANLISWLDEGRAVLLTLFVAGTLLALTAQGLRSERLWIKTAYVLNPWAVSALLLGLVSIPGFLQTSSFLGRAGCVAGYVLVILLVSWSAQTTRWGAPFRESTGARAAIYTAAAALVMLALAFLLDRGLYIRAPEPGLAAPARKRPNVLFVVLDTVRADHTSLYGYERDTTPNLRGLAQDATTYEQAIATSDWTLPTHASMFTGLYPSEHGAYCDAAQSFARLADENETLAEILSREGYRTAGVVANSTMMLRHFNLHQGFQYYTTRDPAIVSVARPPYSLRARTARMARSLTKAPANPELYRKAKDISDEAIALLDAFQEGEQPFFLFLNYMDAHAPYDPPDPYSRKYTQSDTPIPLQDFYDLSKGVMQLKRTLRQEERAYLIGKYDGAIEYMDQELGRVIDRLKQLKMYADAVVVIASDHGEAFGEHNLMEHGVSVYQDQVHIPLLIKTPSAGGSRRVREPVSAADLMPTILDAVGAPAPPRLSGRSLLGDSGQARRFILSETQPCGDTREMHPRFERLDRAVRSGQWKLMVSTTGEKRLYNLDSDPLETNNLYSPKDKTSAELEASLNQWLAQAPRRSRTPAKLDREALQKLKALGYVQ